MMNPISLTEGFIY